MLGEQQRYQNGFDCQGLWIEVEVERELGFNNKRQIEEYGIDRFVELCKARVDTLRRPSDRAEQAPRLLDGLGQQLLHELGREQLHDLGLPGGVPPARAALRGPRRDAVVPALRDRHLATWRRPRATARSSTCRSTLRLPLTSPGHEGEDLLVWTTTPWTLSSNVAAAVHPELTYQLVEGADGRRWWVSAGSKAARRARRRRSCARRRAPSWSDLTYAGPFDELPAAAGVAHRVIPWDEVSDAEGTGIVHIAPGCGQEDFALSQGVRPAGHRPDRPVRRLRRRLRLADRPLRRRHRRPGRPTWRATVVADLERKGLLVAKESYAHSYPHCWRCGTQLIFRLVDEWFIAMDPLARADRRVDPRDDAGCRTGIGLEERELDWLRNMGDWMISKKRYYGLALPIWECTDCDGWEVIGSKEELQRARGRRLGRVRGPLAASALDRRRRDRLRARAAGGRGASPDVGNPWLDAGIVGLSTLKWNTDRDVLGGVVPGRLDQRVVPGPVPQLVLRAADRVDGHDRRGAGHGRSSRYALLRDEHGEEMHKSKGNSIPFDEAAERIGADVMRWMYAAANPATNLNFGYGPGHEVVRRFFLPLWNTYGFFVTYARLDGWTPDQADGVAARSHASSTDGSCRASTRWSARCARRSTATTRMRATRAIEALRRRPVELVRPPQPAPLLEGRARRRQARRLRDAARGAHHAVPADGADHRRTWPTRCGRTWWRPSTPARPDSVHLTDCPERVAGRADPAVEAAVELARRTVGARPRARARPPGCARASRCASVRVKLPAAAAARFSPDAERRRRAAPAEVLDELNVRELELIPDESEMVERTPLPAAAGDRAAARQGGRARSWPARAPATGSCDDDGTRRRSAGSTLQPDEFELTARARPGPRGRRGRRPARRARHDARRRARGRGPGARGRAPAPGHAPGGRLRDQRPGAAWRSPAMRRRSQRLEPHRDWLADELLATDARARRRRRRSPDADRRETAGARRGQPASSAVARA